jgi:NAD(P) transhydrogenase subunit beta
MTQMPELVALFRSMIGLAAVFIAVAEPHAFGIVPKVGPIPAGDRLELFLGAAASRASSGRSGIPAGYGASDRNPARATLTSSGNSTE